MDFLLHIPPRYKTILSAYLSKLIILVSKCISVPLLLLYLPRQEYALLVIFTGLEGFFLLLDFGIGSSLQNALAENEIKKEEEGSFLTTALILIVFSLSVGALLITKLFPHFSPFFTQKIGFIENKETIFLLTGFFFLLSTFGSIGGKILMAKQKGYQSYLIQSFAQGISVICLGIAGSKGILSLPLALVFVFGIPSIASCLTAIKAFGKVRFKGPFQWGMCKKALGFHFFAVMAALVSLSDSLVITVTLSVDQIVEYNVLCKIFGLASFAYGAFIQGLMPECSQHLFLKKVQKVEKMLYKHCFISILGTIFFTLAVLSMTFFIQRSLKVNLSGLAIIAFGGYVCVRVVSDFFAMALQSHSKLISFFYLVPIQAVLSITLQYFFSMKIGVCGILVGLTLSYLLTVCWALPWQLKKLKESYA